jgi:predicted MFS family arabinose efflux permease
VAAPTRRDWIAALALSLALGWTFTCTGAAALPLEEELDVDLAVVGLFTTVFLLAEALTSIPAGRLCDRLGARQVGLAASAVMAAGSGLALTAPATWLIVVARGLTGVGAGLAYVGAVAWLQGGGALAQGLVGGCALGGAGLAVALVPHLDGPLGWRAPFLPELALCAAAAVLAALAPRGTPAGERRRASLRGLLRQPLVWRFGAIASFSFGASFAVGAWILPLLTESDGLSARTGALAGSLILFGGIVTRPLGGAAVRRAPGLAWPLMVGSIVLGAGATLLLALDLGPGVSTIAALLVGLAAGLPYGATVDGALRAFPDVPGEAVAVTIAMAVYFGVAVVFLLGLAFGAGEGALGFTILAGVFLALLPAAPRSTLGVPRG